MKNIHIIPTDKPSRLGYLTEKGEKVYKDLRLFDKPVKMILDGKNQNIYITSEEKIKEGDWCMSLCDDESYEEIYQCKKANLVDIEDRKIILTTDQDLIEDGIQPIDDEFLEWFVKNPTWKRVDINRISVNCSCEKQSEYRENANIIKENTTCHLRNNCETKYQIILPTEEEVYLNKLIDELSSGFLLDKKTTKEVAIEFAKFKQEENKNLFSKDDVLKILLARNAELGIIEKSEKVIQFIEQFKI